MLLDRHDDFSRARMPCDEAEPSLDGGLFVFSRRLNAFGRQKGDEKVEERERIFKDGVLREAGRQRWRIPALLSGIGRTGTALRSWRRSRASLASVCAS